LTKLAIILLALLSIAMAGETLKYSKVKLLKPSVLELQKLRLQGLALDLPLAVDGSLEVILDERELELLRQTGQAFEILMDDVIGHYQDQVRLPDEQMIQLQAEMRQVYEMQGFEFGSMGGYYTLSEVVTELDSMHLLYPELISAKRSIGTSLEGRDIWMLKISDNPDLEETEPQILYTAVHHAREVQSMATLVYYMYYLLENYGKDPLVTFLINHRELYFVPVVNPDGYYYNEQTNPSGGGLWRKNRRDNGDGTWGVDLNRNYGYMWGYNNYGSSPDGSSNVYRGTGPFSEPETQAIRELCNDHDFRLAFNFHSYWNWIFYPWLYNESAPPDLDLYVDLLGEITRYNHYGYAPPQPSNGYQFNGNATDWMYGEQTEKNRIFSMTPEVGGSSDGFWPSQSRIYPLARENVYANLMLALGPGIIECNASLLVETASVSSGYLKPGVDTVYCAAERKNHSSGPISLMALIASSERRSLDSIPMYDDGTHGDGVAGDGLFHGWALAPAVEDVFTVHFYAESDSGSAAFLNDVGSFITLGPLVFEGITAANDEYPSPGETYKFYGSLKNLSDSHMIPAVTARLTSRYSEIKIIGDQRLFGDIEPGASLANIGGNYFALALGDFELSDPADYTLGLEIFSEGQHYWSDSLTITLYPVVSTRSENQTPNHYALWQNFPNPFNPSTTIRYSLPVTGLVNLTIFDIQGREIGVLQEAFRPPGHYEVQWNGVDQGGNSVNTGVYFARLRVVDPANTTSGGVQYTQTIKMVYLR